MMKSIPVWKQELSDGVHAARLASLYCCAPAETASEAARYAAVLDGLEKTFGSHAEAGLYSAPGRTEIGGNHTDHQHGRVLAGSVNIDMIAAAAPNDKNQLRVQSEGYDLCVIDLNDLEARKEEENTTASLLRGECAAFTQRGAKLAGLDVYISSNVPKGSGVSSSAAFEVLIGVILNDCFMTEKVSPIAIAQIGQWAENVYFGKPCGAQDQLASACGGTVLLDFASAVPQVTPLAFDATGVGYAVVLIDSRQDHSVHTEEFASVPADMRMVANHLGVARLGDTTADVLLANLQDVRAALGDGRAMRALHYFDEVARVDRQREALEAGDFPLFLKCVRLSGASSAQFLQNVSPRDTGSGERQPAMLIQGLCAHLLSEEGAWRIHGGGFGGSVLALVPRAEVADFMETMDKLLGYRACREVVVGGPGVLARRLS